MCFTWESLSRATAMSVLTPKTDGAERKISIHFVSMPLKKSKIEKLRKSRECRTLAISAAPLFHKIDTSVGGRY